MTKNVSNNEDLSRGETSERKTAISTKKLEQCEIKYDTVISVI